MANVGNVCNENAKLKYNVTQLLSNAQNIPDDLKIRGNRDIQVIPFIGDYFKDKLGRAGYEKVDHIVRGFTAYPPLSAQEIEEYLVSMCQNKNRDDCQQKRNDPKYHVSDVNQCCFNAILELLREVHRRRIDYVSLNFTVYPNIPNATQVNYRTRGDIDNLMVRQCVCHDSEELCIRNRCRWTPPGPNGTNTDSGACTPQEGEGFRGNNEQTNQYLPTINNQSNVQQVNELPYVRQYRILLAEEFLSERRRDRDHRDIIPAPEIIRRGRPQRIYSGRLRSSNLQGGGIKNIKKEILYAEKWNKNIDLSIRRQFNQMAKLHNEKVKKKNCNKICLTYQGIRHCFTPCSVKDWFYFDPIKTYLGKKYTDQFI